MSASSPASSPRLPSPPPMAEDQLGPLSPSIGLSDEKGQLGAFGGVDHGASRRIRPGTKAADMAEGPPLVELKDIDSAFQLTEHLKALHNSLAHPADKDHSVPIDRTTALRLAQPPDGVDRNIWLYELCRFLSQKANSIIIALFADNPPCSAQTCPEMRASEWQYLCAVHDPPKSCCAIDYCCHTLDWAANTLTSPKSFPSRLALGTEMNNQHTQVRQLTNIFRRVYRIFAHAWFQHRDVFWKVEGRTGLYIFFKTVCDSYALIDKDNYTIPQEAEGLEGETPEQPNEAHSRDITERRESVVEHAPVTPAGNTTTVTGNTTKRHRQTPSLSQAPVTTVVEEVEEDEEVQGEKRDVPQLSRSATVKENKSADRKGKESKANDEEKAKENKTPENIASESSNQEAVKEDEKSSSEEKPTEENSSDSTDEAGAKAEAEVSEEVSVEHSAEDAQEKKTTSKDEKEVPDDGKELPKPEAE